MLERGRWDLTPSQTVKPLYFFTEKLFDSIRTSLAIFDIFIPKYWTF